MQFSYLNRDLETAEPTLLAERQWLGLNFLLRESFRSNPFYQKKFRDAGLHSAADLLSIDDLSRLPFTTKQELVQDQDSNPPFGTNLTYSLDKYVRLHQTSGTTGKPLRWLDTKKSWAWWARCWAVVFRAANVGRGDRIFFPFSFGPFIGFWSAWSGAHEIGALAISGGAQSTEQRLANLLDLNATVVCCTPSYALHLAETARQQNIDLADSSVRALVVAGEPGGSIPETRKRIESAWGAKLYDHTGATEVGATGFTCQTQSGVHLNEAEFIIEVLDVKTHQPSETGELIVTNLGRVGSPIVRYRTGDVVKLNRGICECGRSFARIDGGIIGRADDMAIVRGVNIFPSSVESIVRRHEEIVEYAADVVKDGEMDDLVLRIEVVHAEENVSADSLTHDFQYSLGLRVKVKPVPVGSLPRYELKARRFRDRRKEAIQN
jgi:phenylacetate-CoA ligase